MGSESSHVLVTGANGGLGLGICLRLIDDFLRSSRPEQSLNIIFTTRSSSKGAATLQTLNAHLQTKHPQTQQARITFQPENVELTDLLSVRRLANKLVSSSLTHIDSIVCNAGIGGWVGMNWPAAVRDIVLDIRNNTTWPDFKLGTTGSVTKSQLSASLKDEPPLGEVFCANFFGHYMLLHWLMTLLRSTGSSKIIWVSSIEAQDTHFDESDLQGLLTNAPYEHTKRLTDLIALTSNQPAAVKFVESFTAVELSKTSSRRNDNGPPEIHVYHPGIVVTSVVTLSVLMSYGYLMGIYLARLLGGVWSTVQPYHAAHGATWLALATTTEIEQASVKAHPLKPTDSPPVTQQGRVKWGTSASPLGATTVRPSEVANWGIRGTGAPYVNEWWGATYGSGGMFRRGRKPYAVEAKSADVHDFVAQGARAWEQVENLRQKWELLINNFENA